MRELAPPSVLPCAETSQLYAILIPSVGIGRASTPRGAAAMRSRRPGMAGAGALWAVIGAWRVHCHSTQEARWQGGPSIAEHPGSGRQAQNKQDKGASTGGARRLGARGLVQADAPVTIRETER